MIENPSNEVCNLEHFLSVQFTEFSSINELIEGFCFRSSSYVQIVRWCRRLKHEQRAVPWTWVLWSSVELAICPARRNHLPIHSANIVVAAVFGEPTRNISRRRWSTWSLGTMFLLLPLKSLFLYLGITPSRRWHCPCHQFLIVLRSIIISLAGTVTGNDDKIWFFFACSRLLWHLKG